MRQYVCSECGYSRSSVKDVVEHVESKHPAAPMARVTSYESSEEPIPAFEVILGRMKRWLFG